MLTLLFFTELVEEAKLVHEEPNVPLLQLFPLARERRMNEQECMQMLFRHGGALIGKKKWKTNCLTKKFSDYVTTADEAFLWLCLDTYLPICNPDNVRNANREIQQTFMISNQDLERNKENNVAKTANGNRYGWTAEAIRTHNRCCQAILRERDTCGKGFDAAFLQHCQEHIVPPKRTVVREKTPPIKAWNCLEL